MLYWCFSFWLTSLCIIGSSFIHLIRTDSNVFFLMAEQYSILCMYHSFLIHLPADGHLGCFHYKQCYYKQCCNEHWGTRVPNPEPPPTSLPGSSQCTSPKHPVSCVEPRLVIHFLYDIIHVSMPFSQIIPPLPSPTESKRLFYTSVSLLLSRIQGNCLMTQQSHCWAYTPRKPELKETRVPQCSLQHCL